MEWMWEIREKQQLIRSEICGLVNSSKQKMGTAENSLQNLAKRICFKPVKNHLSEAAGH
jgi:hypothetical protein